MTESLEEHASMHLPELPLKGLADRHPGLTFALANSYYEAASVCLDRHHTSPTSFSVRDGVNSNDTVVNWVEADERTLSAWGNDSDATRDGAYAFALAAVEISANMVAIRRAQTLTGADYYVGDPKQASDDLEGCLRLEVSGVDKGGDAVIAYRLRLKVDQAAAGRSNVPAMACVVGFRARRIVLQLVEGP